MTFATTIGSYAANTRYAKNSINKSTADNLSAYGITLTDGNWVEVEYYINPKNGDLTIFCEGNDLKAGASGKSNLKNLTAIRIGFANSGAGTNAELYLDDIEFSEISEKDYNLKLGIKPETVLPEGVVAKEDFEYGIPGEKIDTTLWGWQHYNSKYDTTILTYESDPGNSANTVAKIENTVRNSSTHRTLRYPLKTALDDGVYSAKFRLRALDSESNTFWVSIVNAEDKMRHFIGFRLHGDEVVTNTNDGIEDITLTAKYDFNLTDWFDIEVVYDLTADQKTYVTVYVNEKRVLNNVLAGMISEDGKWKSDGTIGSFHLHIASNNTSTQVEDPAAASDDGIYASFLVDDIVIEETSAITGINVSGDALTGIKTYFNAVPSASAPKFIAAVYDGEVLKDVAFTSESAGEGADSLNLSKSLEVTSGNTIKVYYWDTSSLVPYLRHFETVVQ